MVFDTTPLSGGFFPLLPPPPLSTVAAFCFVSSVAAALTNIGAERGKKPVPAIPHQAITRVSWSGVSHPEVFFFFPSFLSWPRQFSRRPRSKTHRLLSPPFSFSFSFISPTPPSPLPLILLLQTHREEPLIRSLPLFLLFSQTLPSHLVQDVCK